MFIVNASLIACAYSVAEAISPLVVKIALSAFKGIPLIFILDAFIGVVKRPVKSSVIVGNGVSGVGVEFHLTSELLSIYLNFLAVSDLVVSKSGVADPDVSTSCIFLELPSFVFVRVIIKPELSTVAITSVLSCILLTSSMKACVFWITEFVAGVFIAPIGMSVPSDVFKAYPLAIVKAPAGNAGFLVDTISASLKDIHVPCPSSFAVPD